MEPSSLRLSFSVLAEDLQQLLHAMLSLSNVSVEQGITMELRASMWTQM